MNELLQDTLAVLEFHKVLKRVAREAETPMGACRIEAMRPTSDAMRLEEWQEALKECLSWTEAALPTAAGSYPLEGMLERAHKGAVLTVGDFVQMRHTLVVYRGIGEALGQGHFPRIESRMRAEPVTQRVLSAIDGAVSEEGDVRDGATRQLADIRCRVRHTEREIDDYLERILKSSEWAPYLQDGLITVRFGRRVVPVKNEFRHSVPGIVHDQSGSGQTVFIEPLVVVERQNRLTGLRQEEAREIERILAELTALVQGTASSLTAIHDRLGWFDQTLAMARYGVKTLALIPQVGGESLELVQARHPLLDQPVPMSLSLSLGCPAVVITGPNTGGKTVALKTTGIIVLMALSGLMVPAREGTRIPLYHHIWADIGDEQSLEQNLSTFSGHLVRLAPMMAGADERTLCLIDEIGAGTDPEEGAALAEVMIRHLVQRRTSVVVSTHYSRLKLLGLKDSRIQNALVEFDRESLSPTYRLILGSPGSSQAFYIARRLGFDPHLVDWAETLMDRQALTLADAIFEINQLQQGLQKETEALHEQHRELDRLQAQLIEQRRVLDERLARDRDKAERAWRRELDALTETFNRTINAVRQQEGRERAVAVEALRQSYRDLKAGPKSLERSQVKGTPPEAVGDRVRVAGFHDIGTVMELNGRIAMVQIGSLRLKLAVADLERASNEGQTAKTHRSKSREQSHLAIGRQKSESLGLECDLRGMTQNEALDVLDKYLDDAVLAAAPFVHIIHGKGTGVLRRAIAQQLKGDPRVVRYRLGGAGEGGDGVTVATLEEGD